MKRLYILIITHLLSSSLVFSQNFEWIRSVRSIDGTSRSNDITSDENGNVYMIGHFDKTIDVDPGSDEVLLTANGGNDVFVVKLSAIGDFIWAKQFGGEEMDQAGDIVWRDELLYISGTFSNSMDIDPGSPSKIITADRSALFVAVLNGEGQLRWSYHSVGSSSLADMKVDEDGSIYMTGSFADSCDFDPSHLAGELISRGNADIYCLKIQAGGKLAWVHGMGGALFDVGRQIALDNDGVYVAAQYFTRIDIDPGPDSLILAHSPVPGFDAAIVKFDKDGNFLWVKAFETPRPDAASVVPFEEGLYISSFGFTGIYNSEGEFIDTLKYLPGGTPIYDFDGHPVRLGQFRDTLDFDPTQDTLIRISGSFSGTFLSDLFFIKYDGSFNPNYLITISSPEQLLMRGFSLQTKGAVYFCSEHLRDMTIADDSIFTTISGKGVDEAFIVKVSTCSTKIRNLSVQACQTYPFGGRQLTMSGRYVDTLIGSLGCDSVVVLDLVVDSVLTDVQISEGSLIALQTSGSFQWLRCNDYSSVFGATDRVFIPMDSDDYAVQIEFGSCVDTSLCHSVETTDDLWYGESSINFWPNPVKNYLSFSNRTLGENIVMYSTLGEIVLSRRLDEPKLAVGHLTPGMYIVQISAGSSKWQGKVLKL